MHSSGTAVVSGPWQDVSGPWQETVPQLSIARPPEGDTNSEECFILSLVVPGFPQRLCLWADWPGTGDRNEHYIIVRPRPYRGTTAGQREVGFLPTIVRS